VSSLRPSATRDGRADADALRRVSSGETAALGEVYDRHAPSLLEFAARAVGRAEAEDIVHSVFLRVTTLARTFDATAPSARPWLFGITTRVLQERRRSLVRAFRALFRMHASQGSVSVPLLDQRRDLERGLERLTESKRVVLLLAEVEGFSCDEIAAMLRIPVGTVWTRLFHARRELRTYYKGKDE
jgi:RNA polymerase sigma factor (sigma-70 family)